MDMCRIYGYFNTTASSGEIAAVALLQQNGGPDGAGIAVGECWAVGANRLAVIDPGGGRQPYQPGNGITVAFNGEIYNHDSLRSRLRGLGYTFPDRCDGGIIPALYEAYGESFVELLDGMYSIAVLDQRARPRLLLATDDMGMKPLYYRWDRAARSLHFSSEIPALLGFQSVSGDPWELGLEQYLQTRTPLGEQTMFAEIKVLPPATSMVCDLGGQPRVRRRSRTLDPVLAGSDEDEVASRVLGRLRAEVGRLLVADVPVALITSGGLDSGLVTALAAAQREVHSFNIACKGEWPSDERHYARATSRYTGTAYHQVEIDPADFPSLLTDAVRHLGQPNADPITVSTYALFAAVRDAGFKVALTGDAADELFGGYARMSVAASNAALGADWYPGYIDALAVAPARQRHALYTGEYRHFVRDCAEILTEAFGDLRDGEGTALRRITDFELGYRLPAYHLRRVDHLSMASSVEVRLPFCQRGITELGRALPDQLRIRDGQVKRTLHAAAAGLLPDAVLRRPKQPFTLPITAMLAPGWPLWELARDALAPQALRAAGQLDPGAVQRLFTRQATRPDDTVALTIWALLVYRLWQEQASGDRRLAGCGAAGA
jgi:asparagine synthase (glutamine-hydrolysing)